MADWALNEHYGSNRGFYPSTIITETLKKVFT